MSTDPAGVETWDGPVVPAGTADPDRACLHFNFEAQAKIGRLSAVEDGPITNYAAELRVICHDCSEPFRWIGLSPGVMPDRPMCSLDQETLHAPLRPASADPDFGLGIPGITIDVLTRDQLADHVRRLCDRARNLYPDLGNGAPVLLGDLLIALGDHDV